MSQPPRTFSTARLDRQRQAHARTDGYGRHRHIYLQPLIRRLATELDAAVKPSWLDYGCGKGQFMTELAPLDLFAPVTGYDPAVAEFSARPQQAHDLVTCLDVLDIVGSEFTDPVLQDIAALTRRLAVIDVLTRPRTERGLKPYPPQHWAGLVSRHFKLVSTTVEYVGVHGFERVVMVAAPNL